MASSTDPQEENDAKFWARTVSAILASLDSILNKVGTVLPWVKHWLSRPIIVPHQRANWWHMGRTGDQKPVMQIVSYWYVTNRTDKPVSILRAYIKRPRTVGDVSVKDAYSVYHGGYAIPPHSTTEMSADFWINPPFRREGEDFRVQVVFVDQYGQKRTMRNVEFRSDKRKRRSPVQLAEEAIYKLGHEVEKKVAAVLKDEISRYKKYGRQSGQLGSIEARYKGNTVRHIYQDGWTSSKAGQRQEIVTDPENCRVRSENGDALVEFFGGLENDVDRELFINAMVARLDRNKEYYGVSYLILYVLFRIGNLDAALRTATVSLYSSPTFWDRVLHRKPEAPLLEQHQRYGSSDFLGLLNGLLRYEHPKFTDRDLDRVEEFISGIDEHTFRIGEKINSARAFRLLARVAVPAGDAGGRDRGKGCGSHPV